ncbi:hypothetical protein AAC387_Pa05g3837 [Persea americana]
MEANPLCTSDDQRSSHVRSYECTFCKRGFSNAQALGGHMNIHRKDRAKLKQPSKDNQMPSHVTKKNPSCCPFPTGLNLETRSGKEPTCTLRFPWFIIPREDGSTKGEAHKIHKGELQQLPLFVDSLMGDDQVRPSVSHGYVGQEVDLELRLGPHPQELSLGFPFPKGIP